jgi:hypothetical protein
VGVRGLQRPAPHVQENLRHWGPEGHNKGEKPGHCAGRGKEMQKTQSGRFIRGPALQPLGVPVETRWCIGAVHRIYLVINYSVIEVTFFCLERSIYR